MADIPAGLKPAEIGRFIHRANQLRQVKPAITYYCEYYAINQILEKQLHQADQECLGFTTALMDRLEQFKSEHAGDDVLVDDTVGRAYVEEFAQDTFSRGEKVLRANRVTRNTADTFDAAATFFELCKIWGPPDEETKKKIKFAKWNAARILKAIKEGKDPNETNPRIEEPAAEVEPIIPGMEMGQMGTTPGPSPPGMDSNLQQDMARMSLGGAPSPAQPGAPLDPNHHGLPPQHQGYFAASEPAPPSPMSARSIDGGNPPEPTVPSPYSHPSVSPAGQAPFPGPPSAAGSSGYPSVPPSSHSVAPPGMPPNAPSAPGYGPIGHPSTHHGPQAHLPPHMTPPPASAQPHQQYPGAPAPYSPSQPPQAPSPWPPARPPISQAHSTQQPSPSPYGTPYQPNPHQNPAVAWQPPPPNPEADIDKAQKHAKYAQSALTFDDVPTAVKELRLALSALGVHQ